jgi:hypothetical protein
MNGFVALHPELAQQLQEEIASPESELCIEQVQNKQPQDECEGSVFFQNIER